MNANTQEIESIVSYPAHVYRADGTDEICEEPLQAEHTLDVYVDDALAMRIVCTPTDLVELVLGRLFTEGVIASVDDVLTVDLRELSTKAYVTLSSRSNESAGSGLGAEPLRRLGKGVFSAVRHGDVDGADLVPVTPIPWDRDVIFGFARRFAQDTPMHRKTAGAHSCFLACGEEVLYCREDLGRHNAFDKVIGCALLDRVDLSSCLIFTSGRLPVDMVTKAIRARIPILVSKTVPTDLTVELAREFHLTLICCALPHSMKVFHDPADAIDAPEHAHQWKIPRLFDASFEF